MARRDIGETEFGGKGGLIQRSEDGHTQLTPGEEAMAVRMRGAYEKEGLLITLSGDDIDPSIGQQAALAREDERTIRGRGLGAT